MRVAQAFLVVSGILFAACDGEVVQIGTGGTGTTSANSTVTNATATVGTTAAATTAVTVAATSTGSFMSGDCDAACGKVEMCGAPAGQCEMYVDCAQPQGACLADCVNDPNTDCTEIFAALQGQGGPFTDCAQGCQGTTTTGSSMTTGASTGSGTTMACQQCGQNQCGGAVGQCFQQPMQQCQSWLQCAQGCTDAACMDNCTAMYPSGAGIESCLCTSCSMQCGAVCN